MAQDFEHICPNTLTVSTNYGTAGCSLSVDFQVLGYKDNEPFTYSVAFATQCTPQVGGTAGNNFVVDGNGFNHAPNDTACTGRYANPPPSTDDPAGICVDISQLDPGWGPITIPNLPPGVYYLQVITSSTTTYNFCSGMAVYNDYACVPVTIQPSGGCATVLPTPTPCAALTRHWYMTPSNGLVGTYTNADCGADNTLNLSSTGPVTLTSPLLTGCYMGGTWAFDFWTFTTGTQVTVNFGTSNPGGGGFNPMGSATGTMGTSVVTGGQYDSPVNLSLGSFCLNNQSLVLIVSGNSTVDWNDCADFPSAVFGPLGYGCITPTPTATSTATAPATPTSTPSSTLTSTASATPSPSFTVTPTLTATSTGTGTPTATSSSTSTSTATSTATATNTPTSTPTSTFSSTSTPTPTHSPTLTASNTSTPTPTSTPTLTAIPTDTATKTPTATATVTPSPTPTNTATDTDTPVFTNTPTSTPTNSATATNTSTFTPSFTPTATSTRTPTDTPSSTSTETSTSTSTNTPTDTATLTATDTPVFTLTPTSTPTNSATPTFTNTSTPSPTPTSTSTPTPTDTPSSTSTETSTSTSTHTPTYTATDSMTPTATPSSTPSNTETSTATNTATDTPVFTLTPTSTPTNSATATFTHTFTPSPTPTRTATPTPTDTPSRTPTPTSTFTPSNTTTFTPTPTVTNTFTFSATPSSTFTSSNTATFTPTLTPTSDVEIAKTASEAMAKSGDVITYTITLNVPQGPANGVTVADTLPQYLGFVAYGPVPSGGMALAANGQSLMWVFPVLTGPVTLAYQAKVADYVPGGTLLVNNAQVDCIGNPVPKKASVSVAMAQAYTVKIGVYNEAGELVKQVSVQELSQEITDFSILQSSTITSLHGVVYVEVNGQVIATWDGTNNNGDPVSNGAYYLKVDNIDPSGVDTSVTRQVTVNRSIEKISVDIYNEAGEVVRHLYAWSDDPGSMNLGNVTLSSNVIEPMVGTPTPGGASDLTLTFPNGVTLTWDGRDDKGQIVTNGAYQVEVHWTDGKGGDQVITQQVLVEGRNGAAGAGTVWAAPNVLKRGIAQTMIGVSSNLSLTLSVELYDVAGERVKPAVTGSLGVDQVLVDISGLASGLYLAVVTLRDAQGGFEGRQVVKVLVSH